MKKATEIMYLLGKIFNFIALGLGVLFVILGILSIVGSNQLATEEAQLAALASGITLLAMGIYFVIIEIVVLILVSKAIKNIKSGSKAKAPHIVMIVLGALGDTFFLLGGIFGLITLAQEN